MLPTSSLIVRRDRGQAMVEAAIAFPLLLLAAIGLVQFAIFVHAQGVVIGAVQDGARLAAAEDSTLQDGIAYTGAILAAGLGSSAAGLDVRGLDGGDTVTITAHGSLRTIIPWVTDVALPVNAQAVMSKERFRSAAELAAR